jgi:hypothetical protein
MHNRRVFSSPNNLYLNDFKHPVIRDRIYNNMKWLHESPRSIIEAKTSFLPCYNPCEKPCYNPCEKPCHNPCEKPCYNPCEKPCHNPCEKPCYNPCEKPCCKPCEKPCYNPCKKPCGKPCEKPCHECKQYNNYLYPYGRHCELNGYINNIHAYDRDAAIDVVQNNQLCCPSPEVVCNRPTYKNICYSKQKEYMTSGRFFKSPSVTVVRTPEGRFVSSKEGHVIGLPERTVVCESECNVLLSQEGPIVTTPERMYFHKSRDYYRSFPQKVIQRCIPTPRVCCPPRKNLCPVIRDDCIERKCCNKYVKLFNNRR